MGPYKLVTLDVTNTLLKFRVPPHVQYARVAKQYGVIADGDILKPAFKKKWKTLNIQHPNFGCTTGITSKQWWTEFVTGTFKDAGYIDVGDSKLTLIAHHLFKMFSTNVCWDVNEGAQDLLRSLKERQLTVGVISNFDERLEQILREVGIHSFFDFILCSYLVKCAKPSKSIFQLALQACGSAVQPEEALHVGDNVALDYLAARNAGWGAILLNKESASGQLHEVDQKFVVKKITDVESVIYSD